MKKTWLARPYKYADGVPWNDDRYEIFIWDTNHNKWVSVGGAIKRWGGKTIAFLCLKTEQRFIRTPEQAEANTGGLYVWGDNMQNALNALRSMYPNPSEILAAALASF